MPSHAMAQVQKYMAWREGAGVDTETADETASLTGYLKLIVQNAGHSHMNVRSMREMENLARMLDLLTCKKLPELADHIVQRFKALERNAIDLHWHIANQLEVRSTPDHGLAGIDELHEAGRLRMADERLSVVISKPKGHGRPKARGSAGVRKVPAAPWRPPQTSQTGAVATTATQR